MTTRRFSAPEHPDVDALYGDMASADVQPLWLLEGLMTATPGRGSGAHAWRWKDLKALGERAGDLVPIERGGDRRVVALANPHLGGRPYATSTLWGAVQYLGPGELAPAHRHSPAALRFVLEGEGVWTLVEGDAVPMAPGDLVLTPAWTWHEHHNPGSEPMIWFDGLDLPIVEALDAVFFQPGVDREPNRSVAERSASELRYGSGAGLLPTDRRPATAHSPLYAYRWAETDRALASLVEQAGGRPAALRFADPTTGGDVMATMRCEMHRLPPGGATRRPRRVGSSIWVAFRGGCAVQVDEERLTLGQGDILAVPSWAELSFEAREQADLFCVSDAPVVEALGLDRVGTGADPEGAA
ncbi:MAG TPA: cupin domain-containing protein [Acidimicrobiales bacterium]|nr:cupin domain-containing protein [Acidimicrobiales bacterium]